MLKPYKLVTRNKISVFDRTGIKSFALNKPSSPSQAKWIRYRCDIIHLKKHW